MMKKFPEINKSKGFYFDSNRGLFLIQTYKSKSAGDAWTSPGGNIEGYEGFVKGLIRIVQKEIGFLPEVLDKVPFYTDTFDRKRISYKYQAYWISLPEETTNGKNEGKTISGVPFKFFSVKDLLKPKARITRITHDIINSTAFLEEIKYKEENSA